MITEVIRATQENIELIAMWFFGKVFRGDFGVPVEPIGGLHVIEMISELGVHSVPHFF